MISFSTDGLFFLSRNANTSKLVDKNDTFIKEVIAGYYGPYLYVRSVHAGHEIHSRTLCASTFTCQPDEKDSIFRI